MSLEKVREIQRQVEDIRKACLERRLSEVEAVEAIDEVIGGISRVDYKTGLKLKFTNTTAMYNVDVHWVPKKLYDIIEGLAVLGYYKAKENGSQRPGEVHIDESASTKHHMEGIEKIRQRYAA